ncbi:ABC transporter substrate-binding protein [Sodalis sp. RH16]|uniref:ABC transporter substrate-binding protein n=1 Tax=unclassified Sodalis (in: enterobacteria) TaxID=2636512 RepID=UPI0039B3BAE3
MSKNSRSSQRAGGLTRRSFILASAAILPVAAGFSRVSLAALAGETLVVRTSSGGSYGEAMDRAIFTPFTKATGIRIIKTASDMAPLIASAKQGKPLVDIVDTSEGLLQTLAANGALNAIDYGKCRLFTVDDIGKDAAKQYMVRRMVYARVLGYRKNAFTGAVPADWREFWDAEKFPGARALPGLGLDMPDLEFALLADGVPMNEIYPINIDRALAAYSRIRGKIQSFYNTDAISANLLSTGEVDIEPIANGRIQSMIDEGGGYAIEWNQHMKVPSAYAILKGAKNLENAYRFLDFALSPQVQADFAKEIPYGPVNKKAFDLIPSGIAAKLPTNPAWSDKGFMQDVKWWGDNSQLVTNKWNQWAAQ